MNTASVSRYTVYLSSSRRNSSAANCRPNSRHSRSAPRSTSSSRATDHTPSPTASTCRATSERDSFSWSRRSANQSRSSSSCVSCSSSSWNPTCGMPFGTPATPVNPPNYERNRLARLAHRLDSNQSGTPAARRAGRRSCRRCRRCLHSRQPRRVDRGHAPSGCGPQGRTTPILSPEILQDLILQDLPPFPTPSGVSGCQMVGSPTEISELLWRIRPYTVHFRHTTAGPQSSVILQEHETCGGAA